MGANNTTIEELLNAENEAERQMEQHIANAATLQENIHQQMQQLTTSIRSMEHQMQRITSNTGNTSSQSSGNQQDVHQFDIQWNYCWTHGCTMGNHKSSSCNTRAAGHKADATFHDMKGGSTPNCFWLT